MWRVGFVASVVIALKEETFCRYLADRSLRPLSLGLSFDRTRHHRYAVESYLLGYLWGVVNQSDFHIVLPLY